jgi:protease-4
VSASRGLRLVLGLLVFATMMSAGFVLAIWLSLGREPSVGRESTLEIRLSGDLPEVAPEVLLPIGEAGRLTVRGYVELIRKAKADRRVARLLIRPGPIDSPFWAKLQDLREAIVDFRQSGKPVYAFLESAGDRQYYLASAADRIILLPTSTLDLTGLATYEVFLRGTFDWIGTYPDFLHVGDYKTAVNVFTEQTYTPAHREMSASINRDQFEHLVRAIADGRRKSEADVRAVIDRGPFLADEALELGLVDDLAYEDELDDLEIGFDADRTVDVSEYAGVSWESVGIRRRARVAVIHAVGTIVSGRSRYDAVNGALLGSESIVEHIREVRDTPGIRAIVLRVDSPGGSSVASDVIWRELTITKSPQMPIVVSMSDLAASGGYYIAAAGDAIVAQPGTLTGSIGVYTGKFVTGGTFAKLGANIEGVSDGRHAEMYSPVRPFTDEERARVLDAMQVTYDQFVERVAEARHMTPEKVHEVAQGRVWTGSQARQVGLVDEVGGLFAAVAVAKQRARIPADEDVELVVYPRARSFYELISDQFAPVAGGGPETSAADSLLAAFGPRDRRVVAALFGHARLFGAGESLKHMPYVFVR